MQADQLSCTSGPRTLAPFTLRYGIIAGYKAVYSSGCQRLIKSLTKRLRRTASFSALYRAGEPKGVHQIQGIGPGFVPDILNTDIYDEIYRVGRDVQVCSAMVVYNPVTQL